MVRQSLVLFLCGIGGIAQMATAAEVPFAADRQVSTNAVEIRSLVALDLDGDGDVDLAGASSSGDEVSWYDNDGATPPVFTARLVSSLPSGAGAIAAGDLDQDGDVDLVVASRFDNTVAWFENDGSAIPVWTRRVVTTTAVNPFGVSVADINGDGNLDVLSASDGDNRIAWYENNGAVPPGWTTRTISATALGARNVEAADLDRDGDLDVVSASVDDNRVAWYENNGASPPGWTARTISAAEGTAHAVALGDIDGDGDVDVVSAALTGDKVTWHANDGTPADGGWVSAPVDATVDAACLVTVVDLDRDGDLDVMSSSFDDDLFQWHENDGANPPGFTAREVLDVQDGACAIAVADLDGDGDPDVAVGALLGNEIRWVENRTIHRNALFPREQVILAATAVPVPTTIEAGDFNGDGLVDFVGGRGSPDDLVFYRNTGAPPLRFQAIPLDGPSPTIYIFRLADLDGDLDLDAVVIQGNQPVSLGWYENLDGTGLSVAYHPIPGQIDQPFSFFDVMDVGDLDGDGDADVVRAAGNRAGSGQPTISWFQNDGAQPPSFTEQVLSTRLEDSGLYDGIRITRVNNDLFPDVIALDDEVLTWFESDGVMPTPAFTRQESNLGLPGAYQHLVVGDFDGDADTDAASYHFDGTIYWLEQDSTVSPAVFTPHAVVTNIPFLGRLRAVDLNGDGHLDLMAGAQNGDRLDWYRNDGMSDPTFSSNAVPKQAGFDFDFAVIDLDGDEDLDIFNPAPQSGQGAPELLFNDGAVNPTFTSEQTISPAERVSNAVAADLDRDGDTDVVAIGNDGSTLAWYENDGQSPPGFSPGILVSLAGHAFSEVFIRDLDEDGDLDLVTNSREDGQSSYRWYEQGTGLDDWILRLVPYSDPGNIRDVLDLDGDGDLDLLESTSTTASWFDSDGGAPPSFTQRTLFFELFGTPIVPVDLDGDGDLDLAVAAQFDGNYVWYEQDGGSPPALLSTNVLPTINGGGSGLLAADFDGDGDQDLVVSTGSSPVTFEWLDNDGGSPPTFTARVLSTSLGNPRLLDAADVDLDGDIDFLAGDSSASVSSWYENEGGTLPTFTEHLLAIGDSLAKGGFADVDGDGDADILLPLRATDTLSWLPNAGGQMIFETVDGSVPLLLEGDTAAPLVIEARHAGRPGDAVAELVALELRIENGSGTPLETGVANAIFDSIAVVLDTGSGVYEPGLDPVVTTVNTLSLTNGVQTIAFMDNDLDVRIEQGVPRTYFVVIEVAAGANAADPHQFRITHLTETSSRAQSRDLNVPLTTAGTPNVTTGSTLAATPTSDEDNDQMPDVWENEEFGDPVVAGPAGNADGDGANNLEEYIADTDPTDSASVFQILLFQAGAVSDVSYLSSDQRNYTLLLNDALGTGTWTSVSGQVNVSGTGAVQTLTDGSATTSRTYRVRVSLP